MPEPACKGCGAGLVSGVELSLETCVPCVRTFLAEMPGLATQLVSLEGTVELQQVHLARLTEAAEARRSYSDAQRAGRTARERGIDIHDCPSASETPAGVGWLSGWAEADLLRRHAELSEVVRWAVEALDVVRQLAAGTELEVKVETVRQRLDAFAAGRP